MKKLSCLVAYLFAKPLYVYVYSQPKHINQNVCKTRQSWNYYIWQSKEIYWQLLKRIWHDNTSFFSDKEQGHCSVPWLSTSATSFCKNTEYFSSNTMGKDISQLSHYLNLFVIFNCCMANFNYTSPENWMLRATHYSSKWSWQNKII